MKIILNIGMLGLLFVLTACPKKENEKVNPIRPKNSLIGQWRWNKTSCTYRGLSGPYSSNLSAEETQKSYFIEVLEDSTLKFYNSDSAIFQGKLSVRLFLGENRLYYDISSKDQLNKINMHYAYYFKTGSVFSVSDTSLGIILSPNCYISYKKN